MTYLPCVLPPCLHSPHSHFFWNCISMLSLYFYPSKWMLLLMLHNYISICNLTIYDRSIKRVIDHFALVQTLSIYFFGIRFQMHLKWLLLFSCEKRNTHNKVSSWCSRYNIELSLDRFLNLFNTKTHTHTHTHTRTLFGMYTRNTGFNYYILVCTVCAHSPSKSAYLNGAHCKCMSKINSNPMARIGTRLSVLSARVHPLKSGKTKKMK